MRIQSIRDGIKKIVNNNTIGKSEYHMQQLEEKLQQIQMSINVENGYDVTIKQTEDFISTVKSINDLENGLSLKEEKESLIDVAKRFIEIIKTKNLVWLTFDLLRIFPRVGDCFVECSFGSSLSIIK